jgi:hypothetical protein
MHAGLHWGRITAEVRNNLTIAHMQNRDLPGEVKRGIRFLHAVGRSTMRQGLTVPVSVQTAWAREIDKGQSVPVTICFADGLAVEATLRRINNAVGHLQFRYEAKKHAPLRDYLRQEFASAEGASSPMEVVEVEERRFLFRPIPGDRHSAPRLTICRPVYHNISSGDARGIEEFKDIEKALATVVYRAEDGQREYNSRIGHALVERGWKREVRVVKALGLRIDFERNGVWAEVEFGNARAYYQDYIKFLLAHRFCSSLCGILLSPSEPFANLLCELGRKRAGAKRREPGQKPPVYSGMMTHEKAMRELPYLEFMLTGKVIVAGIELSRSAHLSA